MRVEISHDVDRVADQVYNFLTYDFIVGDDRLRARAYTDEMTTVSLMGRLNADGTLPDALGALRQHGQATDQATALAAMEAMDPRNSPQFGGVLDYLRDRFDTVEIWGRGDPETVAGFSEMELVVRAAAEDRRAREAGAYFADVTDVANRRGDAK